MNKSRARIIETILRAIVAVGVLVGIVAWFSLKAETNRFAAGCVVAGSLLVYLLLAYFFVPNLKRSRPRPFPFGFNVRRRVSLSTIKLFFAPGRLLAMWLIDFIALLIGRTVDHKTTKVDVTL